MMGGRSRDFVVAVGKKEDRLIIMIDMDRILSSAEIRQIAGSLQAAEKKPEPSIV
jgi:chemotaxis signal transduction protein